MDLNSQLNHESAKIESTVFLEAVNKNAETENKSVKDKPKKISIRKDLRTIVFLMYMYFLQGIPLGLSAAIPLILSSRKIGFSVQGTFRYIFNMFKSNKVRLL